MLVAQAVQAGYRVLPIPGASSALAALSVAGDARASGFVFLGFLPSKGAERAAALRAAIDSPAAQLLFEAPHRVEALASALAQAAPQRRITLCRELTKQFETVVSLPAGELPGWLAADDNRLRGEFVLVLHTQASDTSAAEPLLNAEATRMLRVLLRDLPLKQAVGLAAELSGAPRNALYDAALRLKADAG